MSATWSNVKILGSGLECSRSVMEESTDKHKFCSPSAEPEPSVSGRIRTKTLMASPSLLKTKNGAAKFTGGKKTKNRPESHSALGSILRVSPTKPQIYPFTFIPFKRILHGPYPSLICFRRVICTSLCLKSTQRVLISRSSEHCLSLIPLLITIIK